MAILPTLLLGLSLIPVADARRRPRPVTRIPAEAVAEMARARGFDAEVAVDDEGDPMIRAQNTQFKHIVLFYGCTEEGCETVQFRAWWSVQSPVSLEAINAYNVTSRQGRAYLDSDRDPTFEMLVPLEGGVLPSHVDALYGLFLGSASRFSKRIFEGG